MRRPTYLAAVRLATAHTGPRFCVERAEIGLSFLKPETCHWLRLKLQRGSSCGNFGARAVRAWRVAPSAGVAVRHIETQELRGGIVGLVSLIVVVLGETAQQNSLARFEA